jgi:cytosine/adenosine deaminase-related metal-dependent hydrolase
MLTVTARWLFPVAGPPLKHGCLSFAGERITAVEPPGRRAADVDFGNAAILPGLVNAHTHLDLSGMRGLAPPSTDFIAWLRQVIAHRRVRTPDRVAADVRAGLAECLACGTTLVGDISADGGSWSALVDAPLRAVVFRELIGLPKDRAERAWQSAQQWLGECSPTPLCRPGLSPHAPYSARVSLIKAAASSGLPVAVHLAESFAERELLEEHAGPFVPFLQDLGAWDPVGLAKSPEHVLRLAASDVPTLFIHGNYLAASAAVPTTACVVYCPRTHAAFGHSPHPIRDLLGRNIRVALGTDSLASNPDLSILSEMRFLHVEHPDLRSELLLQLATLNGAEALGWAELCGSLETGKSADFIVLPLPENEAVDPHESWLDDDCEPAQVWIRGRQAWANGKPG